MANACRPPLARINDRKAKDDRGGMERSRRRNDSRHALGISDKTTARFPRADCFPREDRCRSLTFLRGQRPAKSGTKRSRAKKKGKKRVIMAWNDLRGPRRPAPGASSSSEFALRERLSILLACEMNSQGRGPRLNMNCAN